MSYGKAKVISVTVGGVVVVAILLVAWSMDAPTSTPTTAKNDHPTFKTSESVPLLEEEIRVEIEHFDEEIDDYERRLAGVENRREEMTRCLVHLEDQFNRERDILIQLKTQFDQDQHERPTNSRSRTRNNISVNAESRLATCRHLATEIHGLKQELGKLESAIGTSQQALTEARSARSARFAELQGLNARLRNARLVGEVKILTESLRTRPDQVDSMLVQNLEKFKRQVEHVEQQSFGAGDLATGAEVVIWNPSSSNEARARLAYLSEESSDIAPVSVNAD